MSYFTRSGERPLPPLPQGALPSGYEGYLDIESTGLSPDSAHVTLVGLVLPQNGSRFLEQYFADTPADEAEVLSLVAARLRQLAGVVTYNGATFDLPFLRRRAALYKIDWPWVETYDLLTVARAWRSQFGQLPNCKLQTVMAHFALGRVDQTSGYEMVEAYHRWVKHGEVADRDLILEHNADDLLLLPDLVPCLTQPPGAVRPA